MNKVYSYKFSKIYPLLTAKALRKGRSEDEVISCISWLTGYSAEEVKRESAGEATMKEFFMSAPHMNEKRFLIKGTICGVKIQEIEDPLYKDIRILDKLIDDLAKGNSLEKILP
ncbi:MAG: DUF2200 family protein [Bullifex sp.]